MTPHNLTPTMIFIDEEDFLDKKIEQITLNDFKIGIQGQEKVNNIRQS
jgi:hypothetical protein